VRGLIFLRKPGPPSVGLEFAGFSDHRSRHCEEVDVAGKIGAILKLSVVACVMLASSSVGYYYLMYLPHRDAQLEPERVLERLRAAAQEHAKRDQLLFEQQESERRAAEQRAAEERLTLERAERYQACLSRATDDYNAARLAACNRPQEKIIKYHDDCMKLGFPKNVCDMAHVVHEASPNCTLPRSVAIALDADVGKARDGCLEPVALDALAHILR
jgi:hypothetical protein